MFQKKTILVTKKIEIKLTRLDLQLTSLTNM